ncbi:DUF58 domain-containing protein [Algoriphagus zhangzhouensis]|uniref:DUF58 domain-containing protein n=1 Tax=Algoriphagus zhangzhouensis TaxID=1073327 RepID=A0A1M7Z7A7_9BACT|nr:DUF58 domain-containing protein [Algoriphagus zhangzhouensis]TDY49250.1 uncharacterized protein DUF58 [Algoriphagus zhangzhouensis]SHO60660.1 Protein of unknown function DUF58 [Algoriphagus zhangzhouensis]
MPNNLEIIKLKDLRLSARLVSEQLRLGIHSGIRIGVGSEFEQYRHYQPGDDLKRIDWKYFSRSGKYMVKESTTESNLHIRMMLDLSGSMNYEEGGFSRLDYAKNLLASLAYIGYLQGDSMSYYTLSEGKINQKVSPTPKSFQRILYYLEDEKASGDWPLEYIPEGMVQGRNRELIIWVSDFLQKENEWEYLVQQFRHPRKELVLVQVLGEQELNFQLDGNFIFRDLESGQELVQDGKSVQETFRKNFQAYLNQLDEKLELPKVHLLRVSMNEPLTEVLRSILNRKQLS